MSKNLQIFLLNGQLSTSQQNLPPPSLCVNTIVHVVTREPYARYGVCFGQIQCKRSSSQMQIPFRLSLRSVLELHLAHYADILTARRACPMGTKSINFSLGP